MKGDCQRFSGARQRRFSVVWDEFSRGFPMSFVPSAAREPLSVRGPYGTFTAKGAKIAKEKEWSLFCPISLLVIGPLALLDVSKKYRKGGKDRKEKEWSNISLSVPPIQLAIGPSHCVRGFRKNPIHTSTPSVVPRSWRGARECRMQPSRQQPAARQPR